MLVFGHTGILLGAAVLLRKLATSSRSAGTGGIKATAPHRQPSQAIANLNDSKTGKASRIKSLISSIDIRLLMVGALLPDIIDKPLGRFFFQAVFSNGRIFGHTLLFLILISVIGLYLYRSRSQTWLLVISSGTFAHLVLDQMWSSPHTLLWPIYGFTFERDLTDWVANIFYELLTDPKVYVPELLGMAIIIWFAVTLLYRRKVYSFINHGHIE